MGAKIEIKDNSKKVKSELDSAMDRALTMIGMQAENYAKLELESNPRRIDTGLLRNSITWALSGESPHTRSYSASNSGRHNNGKVVPSGSYSGKVPDEMGRRSAVYIGTNVDYAIYIHEGARRPDGTTMEPNHFLRNACEKHISQYGQMIKDQLKNGKL